jgi:hypothetical protein
MPSPTAEPTLMDFEVAQTGSEAHATNIATLRNDVTRQLTSFDMATKQKAVAVRRGQRATLGEVTGHGCITQLWITFPGWFWGHWAPSAPVSQTLLKTLILRIYWDGETKPAVETPVGDFFGNGLCQTSNFTSRYFGMSSGGFFCKYPMPYRKGFRIEFENLDEIVDTSIYMNVLYQVPEAPLPDTGYFHAQFRTKRDILKETIDLLETRGKGHVVGCTLAMQGQVRNNISFLEAPEHVYIDDDWVSPRIVGTGTEDYFLGGWYFRDGAFTGDLHGVTAKDYFDSSVAMYRIHDEDAIRFQRRIRFAFQNYSDYRLSTFSYSSVAFYYLDTPEGCEPPLPDRKDLLCWYRIKDVDHWVAP